jgi:hypothetical protein
MATTAIDGPRLEAFMGQAVVDLAAAFSAPLVRLGARLGLYRALAEGGPTTPAELAERTGTEPRMVREWLGNQAAGGYVTYYSPDGPGPKYLAIQGRAHVEPSANDDVYANMIDGEKAQDPERKGVAVVIDVDSVNGLGAQGPFRMEREAAGASAYECAGDRQASVGARRVA